MLTSHLGDSTGLSTPSAPAMVVCHDDYRHLHSDPALISSIERLLAPTHLQTVAAAEQKRAGDVGRHDDGRRLASLDQQRGLLLPRLPVQDESRPERSSAAALITHWEHAATGMQSGLVGTPQQVIGQFNISTSILSIQQCKAAGMYSHDV